MSIPKFKIDKETDSFLFLCRSNFALEFFDGAQAKSRTVRTFLLDGRKLGNRSVDVVHTVFLPVPRIHHKENNSQKITTILVHAFNKIKIHQ
jgi:hypothetical protein